MIGVVGPADECERAAETVARAGGDPVVDDAAAVAAAHPRAVVAIRDGSVTDLVRAGSEAPILPVGAGPGLPSIPSDTLGGAVERVLAGDCPTRTHPLLSVAADGSHVGVAAFDVMLVTTEPTRISEYGVSAGAALAQFRADGVVAATPAGSHDYAHDAGGPRIAPALVAGVVVPVSAFSTTVDRWVVGLDEPVTLSVERDEGEVSVLLDGRAEATVPAPGSVELVATGGFDVLLAGQP